MAAAKSDEDRKVRRQDYMVCVLGIALVLLAKIIA